MAEAALSFVVEKLGNLAIEKVSSLRNVGSQVTQLKDELRAMQCFLKDAAERQTKDSSVRQWISDIRQVAYDAEDAIDTFSLQAETKGGLFTRCVCLPEHLYHLDRLRQEIEAILKKLKEIDERRARFGIRSLDEAAGMAWSEGVERKRRVSPWQADKIVVGFEGHVETLLQKAILADKTGLSIASIVGMGGVGKSTLAKKVYNHERVRKEFERRARVIVSRSFNAKEVLKEMVRQLRPREIEETKMEDLLFQTSMTDPSEMFLERELQEELRGKPYLIVLDDVWEQQHWQYICDVLPNQDKRSILLMTSRTSNIMNPSPGYVHRLIGLDGDESWELFQKASKCPQELENIGRTIVEKCHGLPLAITVMAGLLLEQGESVRAWKDIESHLETGQDSVSSVLELSYWDLPPRLKSCFLCLSFFKEDALIDARTLVRLWIAEGIISQGKGKETMEDIAKSYLNELMNRNMVQAIKLTKDDQVKSCQVHDLLWELSFKKAKEEINFDVILNAENTSNQSLDKPRHLSIHCNNKSFMSSKSSIPHLRSLFLQASSWGDNCVSPSFWERIGDCVRVVELGGLGLTTVPKKISSTLGLKYLGLCKNQIQKLPGWLGCLGHLQTLDISGNRNMIVPNVLWKMRSLRHLYMPQEIICKEEPLKLDTLKDLQTLWNVSSKNISLEHLGELVSLQELKIELAGDVDVSKLLSTLAKLENLASLALSWRLGHALSLDGISKLQHLKLLQIFGKLAEFPRSFPLKLCSLKLSSTNLSEDPMPILGRLQDLSCLKLFSDSFVGEEMVIVNKGFPGLKILSLVGLSNLRQIFVETEGLLMLEELKIRDCGDLRILPEDEDQRIKANLQNLKISGTSIIASKLKGVVEAAISRAVEKLDSLAINKLSSLLHIDARAKYLKDELLAIVPFIKDAAEKQAENEEIRKWISDIREVASDTLDLKVDTPRRRQQLVSHCASFPKHAYHMYQVGQEIKSIHKRLNIIAERRMKLDLKFNEVSTDTYEFGVDQGAGMPTAQLKLDETMEGLEEDFDILLREIFKYGGESLSTSCIVGRGGVGKTTLARKLYNHHQFNQGYRAWVTLSRDFSYNELLRKLIWQLQRSQTDSHDLEDEVRRILRGNNCFIVIDNIPEHIDWGCFTRIFPDEANETGPARILLMTSRHVPENSKNVDYVHQLNGLSPDESWQLFMKSAFREKHDGKCPYELEEIGHQIVEKCHGVPLAITLIAGLLLQQKQSVSGWKRILEEITLQESSKDIVDIILNLSYWDLPLQLKSCFLHMSIFEEGSSIDARTLIKLLVAQGIFAQEENLTMEERARSCLQDLKNRNMVSASKLSYDGQVLFYQMHDLLHDLSIRIAKEERFDMINNETCSNQSLDKVRHLVINSNNESLMSLSTTPIPHLRSLFLRDAPMDYPVFITKNMPLCLWIFLKDIAPFDWKSDNEIPPSFWERLGDDLQVLDLGGLGLKTIPENIGRLIGLTYLGLCNNRIQKLPESLGQLGHLQTLDLSINKRMKIPNILWKLDSLRHLYMPRNISCKKPLRLDTLKNLQTLAFVSTKDIVVEHLAKLTSLRELGLELLRGDNASELFNLLFELTDLVSMELAFEYSLEWILNLQQLTKLVIIKGVELSLPQFPASLSSLSFFDSEFNEDPMPMLGMIPNLLHLQLVRTQYYRDDIMRFGRGFWRLKVLCLANLDNLREIDMDECPYIPLERLEIIQCSRLSIYQLQRDMRLNHKHVQIIVRS
ncbi:uncharacterized protein LOC127251240 [Andrographis paniculata]|uniref:uncharacterized protein LOC127251240 n=1 Tax=Andrographis paniculata TaxID=175694 RepID=UPI0021E84574|nr:uncharacterized protein LOC127251240 [Andrographis paniculata]